MIVIGLVLYRNWRYEQELDSLLWKLDYRDIQMAEENENKCNNNGSLTPNGSHQNNSLCPKNKVKKEAKTLFFLQRCIHFIFITKIVL
jgi:hypothetical protein